jgi:hypothetical protein
VNAVLSQHREPVIPPSLRHRRPISAMALLHQRSALASMRWLVKLGTIRPGAAGLLRTVPLKLHIKFFGSKR